MASAIRSRRSMRTTLIGIIVVAVTSSAAAESKADKARAKKLYDEGLTHYNMGEYADAITAWTESYRLSKAPLLLFNLGQAYRLSGDCTKATTFYDSYERELPDA